MLWNLNWRWLLFLFFLMMRGSYCLLFLLFLAFRNARRLFFRCFFLVLRNLNCFWLLLSWLFLFLLHAAFFPWLFLDRLCAYFFRVSAYFFLFGPLLFRCLRWVFFFLFPADNPLDEGRQLILEKPEHSGSPLMQADSPCATARPFPLSPAQGPAALRPLRRSRPSGAPPKA